MGEYYGIRGKQLYIEVKGNADLPAVLHIHGGPGGVGVTEFMAYQGERLSASFRLVAPDQRGTWRSEAIAEEETLTLEDNIEDFEEIRRQLGIAKWCLLGHSYGGYLTALYAQRYPESISAIVYECPSFSFALAERHLLGKAIGLLAELGKTEEADRYRDHLRDGVRDQDVQSILDQAFHDLKPHGNRVFWYEPANDRLGPFLGADGERPARWSKSNATRKRLLQNGRCHTLAWADGVHISIPSLLLIGKYDPITCPEQIAVFQRVTRDYEIQVFDYSGHSIRVEEPDLYAQSIQAFLKAKLISSPTVAP